MSEKGTITLDLDAITIGEIIEVEERAGVVWDDIVEMDTLPTKVIPALIFVARRREDPEYTYQDALDTPLSVIREMDFKTADPTDAAD